MSIKTDGAKRITHRKSKACWHARDAVMGHMQVMELHFAAAALHATVVNVNTNLVARWAFCVTVFDAFLLHSSSIQKQRR